MKQVADAVFRSNHARLGDAEIEQESALVVMQAAAAREGIALGWKRLLEVTSRTSCWSP